MGFTFAWFDDSTAAIGLVTTSDTTPPVMLQTVTYPCASVRAHVISVTVSGAYTADVTQAATTITVNNAAPVITTTVANYAFLSSVLVGQGITLTVPFTDISPSDSHSLDVDWGDSGVIQTIDLLDKDINNININSFTAKHTFSKETGPFNIKLTLRDGTAGGSVDLSLPTTVTLDVSE